MSKEETLETVRLILARYVKENHMRNTPERQAILELFYEKGGLYTADEVCDILSEGFRVSRATVYNTVELLYSLGLLVRHLLGKQVKYEACFDERDYVRTVCTRCGRTARVQAQGTAFAHYNMHYRRFHPEQIITYVYGVCSSCQSKETRARKKIEKAEQQKEKLRQQLKQSTNDIKQYK